MPTASPTGCPWTRGRRDAAAASRRTRRRRHGPVAAGSRSRPQRFVHLRRAARARCGSRSLQRETRDRRRAAAARRRSDTHGLRRVERPRRGSDTRLRRPRRSPDRGRRRRRRRSADRRHADVPSSATGIKTIDLWCPLAGAWARAPDTRVRPRRHRARVGAVVPGGTQRSGRRVDRVRAGADRPRRRAPRPGRVGPGRHGAACRWRRRPHRWTTSWPRSTTASAWPDDGDLLVVFAETGRLHAIDERLGGAGPSRRRHLVGAPTRWQSVGPDTGGEPVPGFDRVRPRAGQDADGGRPSARRRGARSPIPRTRPLADRARATMTDALDEYLSPAVLRRRTRHGSSRASRSPATSCADRWPPSSNRRSSDQVGRAQIVVGSNRTRVEYR